jgi:hypothetical protein
VFLNSGTAIREQIRSLVSEEVSGTMKLAVAFWGTGIEHELRGANKIICDLESGACNPTVIRALRKRAQFVILKLPGLHAKVVIGTAGAVVSSANMSTNGLGAEGADYSGTIEAGYFVDAKKPEYQKIVVWFEDMWRHATEITEADLIYAEAKYQFRNREMPVAPAVEDLPEPAPLCIDPSEFLENQIAPDHVLRAVHPHIRMSLEHVVKGVEPRRQGKLMMWAVHLLLNHAGIVLDHSPSKDEPKGLATNEWILTRFKGRKKEETQLHLEALLREINRDSFRSAGIRQAASELLADLPWKN